MYRRLKRWILSQVFSGHSPKLFCKNPFEYFEVQESGNVFPCCPGLVPHPIGNVFKDTPEQIWNSATAKDIRRSILAGSFDYCVKEKCSWLQKETPLKAVPQPEYRRVRLTTKPRALVFSHDETCNLSCPSCRTEVIHRNAKQRERALYAQDQVVKWSQEEAHEYTVAAYGDPFSSPVYFNLLKQIDFTKNPRLKIKLQTNGLLFTPVSWGLLKNIHGRVSRLRVSVDAATSSTYAVLRRGGRFSVLLNNLQFMSELRKENKIERLELLFVVQKENFQEMPEFVELGKRFGCDEVRFQLLMDWGTFSLEQWTAKAVHLPQHPEHRSLLEMLSQPIFRESIVDFSNLTHLVQSKILS